MTQTIISVLKLSTEPDNIVFIPECNYNESHTSKCPQMVVCTVDICLGSQAGSINCKLQPMAATWHRRH